MVIEPKKLDCYYFDSPTFDPIVSEHFGMPYSTQRGMGMCAQDVASFFDIEPYTDEDEIIIDGYREEDVQKILDLWCRGMEEKYVYTRDEYDEVEVYDQADASPYPPIVLTLLAQAGKIPFGRYLIHVWW